MIYYWVKVIGRNGRILNRFHHPDYDYTMQWIRKMRNARLTIETWMTYDNRIYSSSTRK